jgi:GrpB-like predicted nucleotidyltransferase (UPF0157 family)
VCRPSRLPQEPICARSLFPTPDSGDWPRVAAELAGAPRDALGEAALRVEHIGSTSIPGMAAKDILGAAVAAAGTSIFMCGWPAQRTSGWRCCSATGSARTRRRSRRTRRSSALADAAPDLEPYTTVKNPAVDLVVATAGEWVAATGWQP